MVSKKLIPRFAVLGAGNGGQAMAGHLAFMGFSVNLYNRNIDKIKAIGESGGIILEGEETGFGKIEKVSYDIEEVLRDANIIMITVPASAHRDIIRICIPHLRDGQIIVLNPGRTGGALEVLNILKTFGLEADVTVAEAQTFIYACRIISQGRVKIFSIKKTVSLAAIPSSRTDHVIEMLSCAYPQFTAAQNVLETSLNNMGAVFHPAPTLLNCGRIESSCSFEYYMQGITPSVARVLEHIDTERIKVAKAVGVNAVSAVEWLEMSYGSRGGCLYEAIQDTRGYRGISAPNTMETRYIFEDIPESLVPISAIGSAVGVRTPVIDSIINLASVVHEKNYHVLGRSMKNMGIEGLTLNQLMELVTYGSVSEAEGVVA